MLNFVKANKFHFAFLGIVLCSSTLLLAEELGPPSLGVVLSNKACTDVGYCTAAVPEECVIDNNYTCPGYDTPASGIKLMWKRTLGYCSEPVSTPPPGCTEWPKATVKCSRYHYFNKVVVSGGIQQCQEYQCSVVGYPTTGWNDNICIPGGGSPGEEN